jgi:hypothetical protein
VSITPMDLQTLFLRLNQVGKEQNHLKEAVASQQAADAKQIKENELRQDHSVNKVEEDREIEKLKDDEKNNQQSQNESENEHDEAQDSVTKKVFKDPEIGSHIDITG